MKIVKASYQIEDMPTESDLRRLERIGRTCYKSEEKIETGYIRWDKDGHITETVPPSYRKFFGMVMEREHESVIEHLVVSVRFIVDRGVSHELVRHRLAAFSQESTRYCDYNKQGEVVFIRPCYWDEDSTQYKKWEEQVASAEACYLLMRQEGVPPEQARSVLPNSLKTEIVVTANMREWRHILRLRTAQAAHPQMREVMCPLLVELRGAFPFFFQDIKEGR